MPQQKDLKRRIRSRMQKTGESYTTARAHLLAKRDRDPGPAEPPDLAARAGMSDAAVRARTGRTWADWVEVLDAAGAARLAHRDIAAHLGAVEGLPAWWRQMVAVGYERIRGRREIGQRGEGSWEITRTRTFPVPAATLFRAFAEPASRDRWLAEDGVTVRKTTADRSVRMTWSDDTAVEATFVAKGEAKSQVTVQHRKLASQEDAARSKAYWAERLAALGDLLDPQR